MNRTPTVKDSTMKKIASQNQHSENKDRRNINKILKIMSLLTKTGTIDKPQRKDKIMEQTG